MKVVAVVPAAGRGLRFDAAGRRKQFRELDGVPVLERACRGLRADPGVVRLVVALPADVAEDPPGWLVAVADEVVAGGETRRASVARALGAVADAEVVLVHDGVRPLIRCDLVRRIRAAAAERPVVPALPLRDTVKEVDGQGRVVRTLDRGRLRRVQTPQGFPLAVLRRVHRQAEREGWRATDDASLCERAGITVGTVPGDPTNLKVTTPEDLDRARRILEQWRAGEPEGEAGPAGAAAREPGAG